MIRLLPALLMFAAVPAAAADLTIRTGETWVFALKNNQPVGARKVAADTKPAKGQIKVAVKNLLGTAMFVTNNSATAYRVQATLIAGGKASPARGCVFPANATPVIEQWSQKADAVRLSNFRRTTETKCD
jgi:hypothetical protein